jgi:predicted kinase
MQKTVKILSGIPGSGKSTFVKSLLSNNESGVVVSADSFFIDKLTGIYNFNPQLISQAHSKCMSGYIEALYSDDIELIIVDNTNIRRWEIENYYKLAKKLNFKVDIYAIVPSLLSDLKICVKRNVHEVPNSVIFEMFLNHEYETFIDYFDKADVYTFNINKQHEQSY